MEKEYIKHMLCLDEENYQVMVFELGIKWLENHVGEDFDTIVSQFARHKIFWNWWRNQFGLVDEVFVKKYKAIPRDIKPTWQDAIDDYMIMHLKSEKYIDKVVLEKIQEDEMHVLNNIISAEYITGD